MVQEHLEARTPGREEHNRKLHKHQPFDLSSAAPTHLDGHLTARVSPQLHTRCLHVGGLELATVEVLSHRNLPELQIRVPFTHPQESCSLISSPHTTDSNQTDSQTCSVK